MANYREKNDRKLLKVFSESTVIDTYILDNGAMQLDKAVFNAEKTEAFLQDKIAIKKRMIAILKDAQSNGMTESKKQELKQLQKFLSDKKPSISNEYQKIETQDIPISFDDMIISNKAYAQKYNIDLSNPYLESLSNIDKTIITNELIEKFDLLQLDKYDYAFATAVGIITGVVDILLVGTATNDITNQSKLSKHTDRIFDKAVEKYARLNGWNGPKDGRDQTKSAIAYLERMYKVNYDQRYSNDVSKMVSHMSPRNHHLLNLDHSPFGLVIGILDLMQGKATFYDPKIRKIVRVDTVKVEDVNGIIEATKRWFGHMVSDVAGSSGAKGRGAGLPGCVQSVLQTFNFGKFPISNSSYSTIGEVVTKMFEKGFDLRFGVTTAIPVIISEVLIRMYWLLKQHFYYGKDLDECVPFGRSRELQRLLLISAFSFSTMDISHAIIKGVSQQNPIVFLNTVNYIGLVNLGFKLFVNFRLEHEHNQKVKEIMQTQIKVEFDKLINENKPF